MIPAQPDSGALSNIHGIDIKRPSRTLGGAIEVFDNVIAHPEDVIAVAEATDGWEGGSLITADGSGHTMDRSIRSARVLGVNQFAFDTHPIFHEMSRTVWHYVNDYAMRYEFRFTEMEWLQVLRYEPGDHYKAHHDAGVGVPRVVSAVLYLNDVPEGGETEFIHFGDKVTPAAGRLVVFPSNYAYSHAARTPAVGRKYAVAYWMRG